ncbi:hypothetical protein Ait01nite_032100 [Actinoplanes italicus]|uniref:Uncharacterized protein n=1 Tax=Actinoplanes italicus TaxID=113567 RepID=A0A2T0KJG5_9ACTN|nr:hypothetical protein [Actinoplanes italicus]PRX23663.1 hypothetical protein CLV67_103412 [Actinoplanes italicus]GIE30165.1 hypothetical protein Ait01nite_032100 [Actinoplanes italicus]
MTAPFGKVLQNPVQPEATAGNSRNANLFRVDSDGTVASVTYAPIAAITGANTNTRSVSLVNKGQSGAGNTVVATIQYNSGVNAAASDENTVTLSGTPANLTVAAGDILQWQSTAVGTGIADPGGLVCVTVSARYA